MFSKLFFLCLWTLYRIFLFHSEPRILSSPTRSSVHPDSFIPVFIIVCVNCSSSANTHIQSFIVDDSSHEIQISTSFTETHFLLNIWGHKTTIIQKISLFETFSVLCWFWNWTVLTQMFNSLMISVLEIKNYVLINKLADFFVVVLGQMQFLFSDLFFFYIYVTPISV